MNLGSGKRCQIEALYTYTGKTSCDGWKGISLEECQVKCDKNEVHNFSYPIIHNSYFFSFVIMFLFLSCFYIFISWISLYFVTSSDFFIIIALRQIPNESCPRQKVQCAYVHYNQDWGCHLADDSCRPTDGAAKYSLHKKPGLII